MKKTKKYLQPKDMLLNAIHDVAELQKGKTTLCDSARGQITLLVTVYGAEWEYQFHVTDIGGGRSEVKITLDGESQDKQRLIDHEFALLDYALIDRAKADLAEIEETDRIIRASCDTNNAKAQEEPK